MDELILFISDRLEVGESVILTKIDTGVMIQGAEVIIEPIWDDPTEATLLKVTFKGKDIHFNTYLEVIRWLQGRMIKPVGTLPLLELL